MHRSVVAKVGVECVGHGVRIDTDLKESIDAIFMLHGASVCSRIGIHFPVPDRGGSTPHTIIDVIAFLYGVPPCSLCGIHVRIGLDIVDCSRRVVVNLHEVDGLCIRKVGIVCPLYLDVIAFHDILFLRVVYLPGEVLIAAVLIPFVNILTMIDPGFDFEIMYLVVSRDIYFVRPNPSPCCMIDVT